MRNYNTKAQMDPISLILAFALKNPEATAELVDGYGRPGNVSSQNLQSSVADFAMGQANKCTWWMPWRLQAMKDVVACDKLRYRDWETQDQRY